jgi:hypothetical protein
MSLTPSDRYWHRVYEALPHDINDAIDAGWQHAVRAIRETGDLKLLTAGDDRAETLVAAITRFVVESNPTDARIRAALSQVEGES